MPDEKQPSASTEGIDPKLAALLCYLISIIGGIVFYMISKDKFVRFHALQSILLGVACTLLGVVLGFIPILWFFSWLIWPGFVALSIVMMVKSYQGAQYKLPLIGDFAEKNS